MAFEILEWPRLRAYILAPKNSRAVEIRQVPQQHTPYIRKAFAQRYQYIRRFPLQEALKGAVAHHFGDVRAIIGRFHIFADVREPKKTIWDLLEISLGHLDEIGRKIDSNSASTTLEYWVGDNAITATEIEHDIIRLDG